MSPLAAAVYAILRERVPAPRPEIAYEDLCLRLRDPFTDITPYDQRLWAALGEIVHACRAVGLPALPAIVLNKHTRVPGKAYYRVAHPNKADDEAKAMIAWGEEVQRVRAATYPGELP